MIILIYIYKYNIFIYNMKKNQISRKKKLAKYVEDYTEKYKTLLRGIREDLNKQRDTPYSWISRFNVVNIPILPQLIQL